MPTTSSTPAAVPMHVALLRGINVGGKNKLPMTDLTAIFTGAGCSPVRTYIQSGNVVFGAKSTAGLADRVQSEIERRVGVQAPVVLRTAEEMQRVVRGNPFLKARVPEALLHVYFLGCEAPAAEAVKALDAERSPGDSFLVQGREIYLHLPNGAARTKLTNAYFDKAFETVSTLRNWRTVMTLTEWASA